MAYCVSRDFPLVFLPKLSIRHSAFDPAAARDVLCAGEDEGKVKATPYQPLSRQPICSTD
jgi:hypothetical protein